MRKRLTLPLLLLALSTLFLHSVDKGYLYRFNIHDDYASSQNLVIAENLSPDHGFRLFVALRPGSDGAPAYQMYSRFPVGGYALVKLAILPFGNDLSAKVLAARMLMLLLFSAAAVLAFQSLARITSRPWVALASTLAAFSSYYMLAYNDAVYTEASVDLFAVMLAFHGMVVFVQEERFPQLLAKTGAALFLGWHVYAFLLPFILLGLGGEAVRAWKHGTAPWLRSTAVTVLRSRYTALGLAALLFGAALLTFNFANEYAAFGGETPVIELPSFRSMLGRTGLNHDLAPVRWWLGFLQQQVFRVCVASVPFVLTNWGAGLLEWFPDLVPSAPGILGPKIPVYQLSVYLLLSLLAAGAAGALVRLAGALLAGRQRLLLATLALSGFCWALPMRYNVAYYSHIFEAMYYVGVPLVFYSLLLLYVHKRWGHRPVVGLAVAALLAFVVSAFQVERRSRPDDARVAEVQRTVMAELGSIRETTRGKVVLVLGSVEPEWSWQAIQANYGWRYYLAGSVLLEPFYTEGGRKYYPVGSDLASFPDTEAAARASDFIVTRDRVESDALLTPGNERVFLYDSAGIDDLVELYRATYQRVASGEPAARSRFDVYLGDRALFHVKEPCVREDVGQEVIVEVVPEDLKDLPRRRRGYGFERQSKVFQDVGVLFEGKCIAILSLPDYPISRIRTEQRPSATSRREGRRIWKAELPAS